METELKLFEIVQNLNAELYERIGEDVLNFGYLTNGFVHIITFDDSCLWNSEDDDRMWIDEEDRYEDMEQFIKNKFNKHADHIHSLKFVNVINEDKHICDDRFPV